MHPVVQHFSEEFFLPPAEGPLCRRVHKRDPSLGVPQEQRIGSVVRYGMGKVELVPQRLLGLLALGNILASDEYDRSPVGIPNDARVFPRPQHAPIFANLAGFPGAVPFFWSPQAGTEVS